MKPKKKPIRKKSKPPPKRKVGPGDLEARSGKLHYRIPIHIYPEGV